MNALLVVLVAGAMVSANDVVGSSGQTSTSDVLRTCSPVASYRMMQVAKYQPACVISLRHPIEGVVECALRDAMMLKIARPDVEVPNIRKEIDRLTTDGATQTIRYKAWLAKLVYENPDMFVAEANADFFTAEEAFAAVARRLEVSLLAARQ
jgi:hypothetical protein